MNAEDWKIVQEHLETSLGWPIALQIEGRRITLRTERVKGNTLGVCVYIDGWLKGEWIVKDVPERRFFQPVSFYMYKRKFRESAVYRKFAKKQKFDLDVKGTYYRPYFSSFKALKRHYMATFPEIELAKEAA